MDRRRDYAVNNGRVDVCRNGVLIREKCGAIGVGDIVRINDSGVAPADVVILSSRYIFG